MDEHNRLVRLKQAIQSLDRLDAATYEEVMELLPIEERPFGLTTEGKLRVVFFDSRRYDRDAFEKLADRRVAWKFIPAALSIDTANAVQNCRAICIFVNDLCDRPVIEALAQRGVELIALRCAGFNHVDLDASREHDISVVRVPAYSPFAVAEHSVALMLMLNRKLHQAYMRNRAGYFVLDGLTGFDMKDKTVGIVGTGAIGRRLADILLGFRCKILAYDKRPHPELQQHQNVRYVDLPELLAESDIVSLHVPLFEETHYLIDREAIEQMKRGVMLINTSRGGLVDTRALIDGLKSGQIGSAGLDVYEEESGVFFHDRSNDVLTDDVLARLMTFNNVVVTSHQAFLTREALDEIATTTRDNIHEFLDGKRGEQLTHRVG